MNDRVGGREMLYYGLMMISAIVLAAVLPVYQYISESVDKRIAGVNPTNALERFLDYPSRTFVSGSHPLFTPNPRFWAKEVDFSCASPWNSACGVFRAGTLVSKRHVLFAQHFPLWKGVRIAFVDGEGQTCVCSIEKTKAIPQSDITVGLLDYEVTPNIHPAKILPLDFRKYIGDGAGLPVVTFSQTESVTVADMDAVPTNLNWRVGRADRPKDAQRLAFSKGVKSGDSGNPAFLVVGKDPLLLYTQHGGVYGSGSSMHSFRREIQAAMDELCPGYKLEVFDFAQVKNEM